MKYKVGDLVEYKWKEKLQYGKIADISEVSIETAYHITNRDIETHELLDSKFYVIWESDIIEIHNENSTPPATLITKLRKEITKKKRASKFQKKLETYERFYKK